MGVLVFLLPLPALIIPNMAYHALLDWRQSKDLKQYSTGRT